MTFKDWRFNLRKSNTESLIRLNIETKGNALSIPEKIKSISELIRNIQN